MFVIKCKPFLLSILVPVLIGFISGMIILPDVGIYSMLQLPPGAPPAFVFPIVWTILYVLMGISSYFCRHFFILPISYYVYYPVLAFWENKNFL